MGELLKFLPQLSHLLYDLLHNIRAERQIDAVLVLGQGDLYGQTVRMEFYKRLRGERKFPSLEALKDEVMRNAEQTRAYFST